MRGFSPKRLVFSGGGTRCLVFLPALQRLETEGRLAHVKEWWGTSAGSLLAALLGLTGSVSRVTDIMHEVSFAKFRDISLMNMVSFTTAWGLDDGYSMVAEIERILELAERGASTKTLADVSGVHIVVADLNLYETVVCSQANFPTLRIADAIRASMSLPVLYRPFKCPVNGHIWVDGGLRAAFPWDCLPSHEARAESLGFAFERSWSSGPRTFMEYVFSMLHFEDPKQIVKYKKEWKQHIIWFPPPPFPAWYVGLQADDCALLDTMATTTMDQWLSKLSQYSQEMTPDQPLCEDRCTPSPACPPRNTGGMLDSPPPFRAPFQAPFRDSQLRISQSRRRWSL